MKEKLAKFLIAKRNTPKFTTGVNPARLLLGRPLRTRLDLVKPNLDRKMVNQQHQQSFDDDVATSSSLGPLLANVFMSLIEENLEREGKLHSFYRRYVDDTLTIMPNIETASNFPDTLNKAHSSVKFMTETECNGMPPFPGIQLLNRSPQIETKVHVKPTNSSLLLHYQSHVDNRYKQGLLRTMLDRAYRLSSCW